MQAGVKRIRREALPLPNKKEGRESAGGGDDGGRGFRRRPNDPWEEKKVFEVLEELAQEMRTTSAAYIGAELLRRAAETSKVAETSCHLRGTYIKHGCWVCVIHFSFLAHKKEKN